MIFVLWIVFSLVVGAIGSSRNIGFWGAFLLSLLLSPVIGLIIALVSKDKQAEEVQEKQLETLEAIRNDRGVSVADEIEKLIRLKENGTLNEEEFEEQKKKLLA